jgi:hypothetical protein
VSEAWHSAVAAARVKRKPIYLVECLSGGTVEATASLDVARQYVKEASRPHLYRIYEQRPTGALYEVKV